MSATSTTYDVRVKYLVDDNRAKGGLRNIGAEAAKAGRNVDSLGSKLRQLATGAAAYFGFRAGYNWLVKYNAELEGTHSQLRTVLQLNTKSTFAVANQQSARLMGQFREDAKQSAGTMQDMANFAADIANPVLQAGGTVADLREITKGSVVASAAMFPNMPAEMAALDVTQAMQGTLTSRDRFAKGLISSQGMNIEQFNALDAKTRVETFKKALKDPAILEAAKAYENSFHGVTSTLKDNLQQILGGIGLPLFKEMVKLTKEMNAWISKNSVQIGNFAREFAGTLKDAFGFFKSIMGFVFEHRALLMSLAKAWLVGKAVKGVVGGMAQGVMGVAGFFTQVSAGEKGLSNLAAKAGMAASALGAIAMGAQAAADFVLRNQEQRIQQNVDTKSLMAQYRLAQLAGQTATFSGTMQDLGALDKSGNIDLQKLRQSGAAGSNLASWIETEGLNKANDLVSAGRKKLLEQKTSRVMRDDVLGPTARALNPFGNDPKKVFGPPASAFKMSVDDVIASLKRLRQPVDDLSVLLPKIGQAFLGGVFAEDFAKLGKAFKPQVNVGKIVMNVESNDPDAFAIGMENYFKSWVRNPTSNPKSVREGT